MNYRLGCFLIVVVAVLGTLALFVTFGEENMPMKFELCFNIKTDDLKLDREQKQTVVTQRLTELDTHYAAFSKLRNQPSKPPEMTEDEWQVARTALQATLNSLKAQYDNAVEIASYFDYEVPQSKAIPTTGDD